MKKIEWRNKKGEETDKRQEKNQELENGTS